MDFSLLFTVLFRIEKIWFQDNVQGAEKYAYF